MNLHAACNQSLYEFKCCDATAGDYGCFSAPCMFQNTLGVFHMIKFEHTFEICSGNFHVDGLCTCRDQELVITQWGGAFDFDGLIFSRNFCNMSAQRFEV